MHVQLQANLFHKLKFKNEWIYASPGETIFITCDNIKRSENHYLEGVGILSLNETCKAYATRDILIPHKVENEEEYIDFIPNSKITEMENIYIDLSTNVLKNKHVRTNQMSDLDLVAKSTAEIKEIVGKKVTTDTISNSKSKHDYLLYVISAITIVSLILFMASCIEQLPWYTQAHPKEPVQTHELGTELVPTQFYDNEERTDENQANSNSGQLPQNEVKHEALTPRSTAYSVYPTIPSL